MEAKVQSEYKLTSDHTVQPHYQTQQYYTSIIHIQLQDPQDLSEIDSIPIHNQMQRSKLQHFFIEL